METALHSFYVSLPLAVALWVLLLALGVVVATSRRARRSRASGRSSASSATVELRRQAEAATAAERAADLAARRRDRWLATQAQLETAWAAFDVADQAARRAHRAMAFPLLSRRRKLGDNAERERYLHHAATAACRQREISIAQLNEALAHRGWNPRLHPVVQEAVLRNAVREHLFGIYRRALEHERAAWAQAEEAAEALLVARAEAAAGARPQPVQQEVSGARRRTEQWTPAEVPAAA